MTIASLQPGLPPRAETFARRVRGLLAEAGQDQRVIAKALSVSASSASRRVRGEMEFGLGEMDAVAVALDTSVDYLLGLTNDRSPRRAAPGGGSLFVMPERNSGVLRACRDSNPKPSDLVLAVRRWAERLGHLVVGGADRTVAGAGPDAGEGGQVIPLHPRRPSHEQVEHPLPAVVIPLHPARRDDVAELATYVVDWPVAS